MKVTLIDYTGAGSPDPARHAANVLIFTKSTRLEMSPGLMADIQSWDDVKVMEELDYMARTIPSSWEFVHYSFLVEGVTRAFTHQFVRTRTGSYAQQTMRVLNVNGWDYGTGPTIAGNGRLEPIYADAMDSIGCVYDELIDNGAAIEDARGILPTNIFTNIVAGFSLRTVCDLVRKRSSSRTQGEYRAVLEAMKDEVMRVHPWAEVFINRDFDIAAGELEAFINSLHSVSLGAVTKEQQTKMVKLIDQMRQS